MFLQYILLAALTATVTLWQLAVATDPVWPNDKTDELERLLFEQEGFRTSEIAVFAKGCAVALGQPGRIFAAEWLRNAYHDMATADVLAGTGGMDASILYEQDRDENEGDAFLETRAAVADFQTRRSSMADLFALALVFAVGACSDGDILVPLRGGRVDATGPGPSGVPQPHEDIASHTASFARQGFNATEMIALVACGHTIGGVHDKDFPTIVPVKNSSVENSQFFDTTRSHFDNRVAIEFVDNTTNNALAVGANTTTRSDQRIFTSDGGKMIGDMAASNDYFTSTCSRLLERMINTVPRGVVLSDVVELYPVKPWFLNLGVSENRTMTLSGIVRIADALLTKSSQVRLHFNPRSGKPCSATSNPPCAVATATTADSMKSTCVYTKCPATFTYFQFKTSVPISQGVSSFIVEIMDEGGAAVTYDNGGNGFPWPDTLQPQLQLSHVDYPAHGEFNITLHLVVAVLNAEQFTSGIEAIFYEPTEPTDPQFEQIAHFSPVTVPLAMSNKLEGTNYTFYNLTYTRTRLDHTHPFDVVAKGGDGVEVSNTFNDWLKFPGSPLAIDI
ncbi:heme peroxidase [Apodospora peruviana]|uniref:Peroxidase n=1 Tax=Apodospora peruviana TaxID=516989 RepID=A0AAE0I3G2_9PEZI|nr:heme peroxidase [Apodospora peruviana]